MKEQNYVVIVVAFILLIVLSEKLRKREQGVIKPSEVRNFQNPAYSKYLNNKVGKHFE